MQIPKELNSKIWRLDHNPEAPCDQKFLLRTPGPGCLSIDSRFLSDSSDAFGFGATPEEAMQDALVHFSTKARVAKLFKQK